MIETYESTKEYVQKHCKIIAGLIFKKLCRGEEFNVYFLPTNGIQWGMFILTTNPNPDMTLIDICTQLLPSMGFMTHEQIEYRLRDKIKTLPLIPNCAQKVTEVKERKAIA